MTGGVSATNAGLRKLSILAIPVRLGILVTFTSPADADAICDVSGVLWKQLVTLALMLSDHTLWRILLSRGV